MKPTVIKFNPLTTSGKYALIKCPDCGLKAWIDKEQFNGQVSIDCPECYYHQTHNLMIK